MVSTLTINPSLDKTLEIDGFAVDRVNRANKEPIVDPGGKGINVSKVLSGFGVPTKALGFVGGETGRALKEKLKQQGIAFDFIEIDGPTRVNTKILDSLNGTMTDINELGPKISSEDIEKIKILVKTAAQHSDFFVFSGSLAESVPVDIYKILMEEIADTSCKVVLDTSGEPLRYGISAGPWLTKPNLEEFQQLAGKEFSDEISIGLAAKEFVATGTGIEHMAISLGERGLLYISKETALLAQAPKIRPKSTTGAGDTVVAALVLGFLQGKDIEEILKFATAMGTAAVMEESNVIPSRSIVERLICDVKVIKISG